MKRTFAIAIIAMVAAGCGGPVVTSERFASPNDGLSPAGAARVGDYTLPTYGLPVAYYSLSVKSDNNCVVSVSLSDKPIYVRDENFNYALHYHHGTYTSDTLAVQTDGQGLLMAVNTTSENNLPAIIDQAFAIAAQAAKVAATRTETTCPISTATYVFDPLNTAQRTKINNNAGITIDAPVPLGGRETVPSDSVPCPIPASDAQPGSGTPCIYFRVLRMYRMDVHVSPTASAQLLFSAPDQNTIYAIPMNRKAFVKFDVKLTFDHGVLTKFESNDPSQALAVLQIPANLIKDILGLETPGGKK